ncbi:MULTISPECIES: MBL fold metallo-hydrolase [unclassified Rhizobium]|jgi:glyoxylase-like metal-dependent hydrolase (beta-lactamase superfamily II)|uniref:MBL fold metallo-hydrolase n=1 Tax=unclassified Rhizobium TaxID=2613769 RepID=UPI000645AC37|nr:MULTISPECIES: MBL fold metallo-hydrolase [unclassified Rhizobium]OJY78628.1 MAG: MBL fold metallo-hydrolase [Rhizobium sp. 60-20]RKD35908.1 glyoxylase-like metal-dependent hydrolase (beta-lactamase superfamily II) [Rhizobium sp. WW_1]
MERVAADKWYAVGHIGDGITAITEPFIQEFYRCNIWHVRGRDRDMLVDSGMGVVSLREWVPLVSERDLIAVASHTHFDHIGCHHEFECRAVHAAEADLLANPTRKNTLADPYVVDEIFDALPPEPYCSKCYAVKKATATRILDDGDIIDLGDRIFEVVHTPGHSPGGIALWEAKTATLFSGDILYDGPLIEDTYHSNAADYFASMERLLRLPARIVHGGHFPSFSGERYRQVISDWLDNKQKSM